jgi:hypothetical protein
MNNWPKLRALCFVWQFWSLSRVVSPLKAEGQGNPGAKSAPKRIENNDSMRHPRTVGACSLEQEQVVLCKPRLEHPAIQNENNMKLIKFTFLVIGIFTLLATAGCVIFHAG